MKTWSRYFLSEFAKTATLFLFCFWGLYILIDYSSHTSSQIPTHSLLRYYLADFSKRAEVLLPFAIMIATIRTLWTLNSQRELVALRASGLSLKTLIAPFLSIGLLTTLLLYLNQQYFAPRAETALTQMATAHHQKRLKSYDRSVVQNLILPDQSRLIYQHYNPATKQFQDVFWIRSLNDIWRIESLSPTQTPPLAHNAQHLTRSTDGQISEKESFETLTLPELIFNSQHLRNTLTAPEEISLTTLWKRLSLHPEDTHEAEMLTSFCLRVLLPWLSLLAVLGPAPFCVRFSRTQSVLPLYIINIFGLVALYLVLDAATVLSKRQLLTPWMAIGFPFFAIFGTLGTRYWRLQ